MRLPALMLALAACMPAYPVAAERADLKPIIASYLGTPPASCMMRAVGEPVLIERQDTEDGTIERRRADNCAGTIEMLIGLPRGAKPDSTVILALPQTGPGGAGEVFGLGEDTDLAFARRFLRSGYVVISPDVFINGTGLDSSQDWSTDRFYRRFPGWSALGRMLVDHVSVLDLLPRLGRTPSCIAAIGHSLGGHNAIFLSAFDSRVDVTISSGGFESIATDDDAERWSRSSWFVYAPALRNVVTNPAPREVPWDFADLLALISPRAVKIIQGDDDPIWTRERELPAQLEGVAAIYARAGLQDRFSLSMFAGGHVFPDQHQEEAVQFVRNHCHGSDR